MGQHRSLQDMIDSVLQGIGEDAVLAKVAAEEEEDDKKSNGEKKMTKAEAERKAEEEESQQGGGTDAATTPSEKTASERVFKLASAVEEVVAALAGDRQAYSRVVTAQEEKGDQAPGRLSTDEKQQPGPADSGEFGEAKQTIPAQPAMETARPKEPQNHVKTDEMMNVTQTAVKEASVDLLGYLRKMAAAPLDPAEYSGGPVDRSYAGAAAHGAGKQVGLGAAGTALGAIGGLAALRNPAVRREMFDLAQRAAPMLRGQGPVSPREMKQVAGGLGGALGLTAAIPTSIALGQNPVGEIQKERAKRDLMARLAAAQQGGAEMAKEGEDAINPANITTAKGDTTLNTGDPTIAKAPGADEQRAHLATNEAAEAMTKEDAKAVPKRQLADYLEEPAQTAATDRTLDVALGADRVNEAGAKIASDRKLKIAAARALLQKIASEGCSCNREHLEKGNCQFCKVAARIKQSGCNAKPKMPPKKGQMGSGSAVPTTVQSSDTTTAGGGMGAGGAVPPM